MSKLHKVNNNGTLSLILPKKTIADFWHAGDEVSFELIGCDLIFVQRSSDANQFSQKISYKEGLEDLEKMLNLFKTSNNNLLCEDIKQQSLKILLAQLIQRL